MHPSNDNTPGKENMGAFHVHRSLSPLSHALQHALMNTEDDEAVQRPVMDEIEKLYEWFEGCSRLAHPAIGHIYETLEAMLEVASQCSSHHRYIRTARIYQAMILFLLYAVEHSTEMDMETSDILESITKDMNSWNARDMQESEPLILRGIFTHPPLLAMLEEYNMSGGLASVFFMQ